MLVRQKIAIERKRNNISVPELASMLNINKGTLNRWENGNIKKIPASALKQMADIFHISLSELIGDDSKYFYLLPEQEKRHSSLSNLSDEENAIITWYRDLSAQEKDLVSRLWRT